MAARRIESEVCKSTSMEGKEVTSRHGIENDSPSGGGMVVAGGKGRRRVLNSGSANFPNKLGALGNLTRLD